MREGDPLGAPAVSGGELISVIVPGMVSAFGVFWMTQYIREALPYELIMVGVVDATLPLLVLFAVAGREGGKGDSIWDVFAREPGAIVDGSNIDVACDSYHRIDEDVALRKELSVGTFRFSVSWARVMPDGRTLNEEGLAYYERLGDRVDVWTTLNEPWCSSLLSYAGGERALSHTDPDEAVAAARRIDGTASRLFLDPIFRGAYPEDVVADVSAPDPADRSPLVSFNAQGRPRRSPNVGSERVRWVSRGLPRTSMDWEVGPDDLRILLTRLDREFTGPAGIPLVVTENGAAYDDVPDETGYVDDSGDRLLYVRDHLAAVHAAIAEGANVAGYLEWSLLDNFEWAHGYTKRFGIVRVDYDSQQRTPKASALWYRDVMKNNALDVD
ncbi:glycoside hydrolase family 1 protein [Actinomyces culturomici]|uniref:glycoside hydrolase family 1 protein n=1 Tax=Actinomyces culturomici TaxID=1926276 RepID=UPI001F292F29|nr:family 1 glycosylhydrolase [Actinomyces culturomici]